MDRCAEYKCIGFEDILLYVVHVIPNRALGYRFFRFAISAGKTILTYLNVVFKQVDLLDLSLDIKKEEHYEECNADQNPHGD